MHEARTCADLLSPLECLSMNAIEVSQLAANVATSLAAIAAFVSAYFAGVAVGAFKKTYMFTNFH